MRCFSIAFVVSLMIYGRAYSNECASLSACTILPATGPWSSDCPCGTANSQKMRDKSFCCFEYHTAQECIEYCGLNIESLVEYEECEQPVCYNSGIWNETECACTDRYYGRCCENRVSICEAVPADVSTEFQFAVVTFSTGAVLEIEFDSTLTKEELKTQVLKIPYRPGATYTHKGLDIATTLLARRQNRLAGLSIMKFVFVLTDSMSSNRLATEAAARNLRKDAYVVSIGIGSEVSHKELHKIASPPDSYSLSYVYSVENFDALNTLIDRLIDATCEKCGVSSKSDIVGVIDNLSESAMNREEFQAALNGLTYIAQHL
ncbi:hypothetical protein DPMN_135626 [Dreissena polymorpha]|uniref:VWFA domain-containing protein n=1 Tax=Dreissena polymorpha TaxID=45954 RepID=A0A9D4JBW4_DREPO|nr:hypothetical protein DPMN_135626 [Dreissena polymorpha]